MNKIRKMPAQEFADLFGVYLHNRGTFNYPSISMSDTETDSLYVDWCKEVTDFVLWDILDTIVTPCETSKRTKIHAKQFAEIFHVYVTQDGISSGGNIFGHITKPTYYKRWSLHATERHKELPLNELVVPQTVPHKRYIDNKGYIV